LLKDPNKKLQCVIVVFSHQDALKIQADLSARILSVPFEVPTNKPKTVVIRPSPATSKLPRDFLQTMKYGNKLSNGKLKIRTRLSAASELLFDFSVLLVESLLALLRYGVFRTIVLEMA
jgi:hypothetical protein